MKKLLMIFGLSLLSALLILTGCELEIRKEPYLDSIENEPKILREDSHFTLLYKVVNPSEKSDHLYLDIRIPRNENCITFRNRFRENQRIDLGEIDAKSSKSYFTEFSVEEETEGQECYLSFILYPSETSDTPIYMTDVVLNIAQGTR